VGEVVGVFADVKPHPGLFGLTFRSSVQVPNLISIEQQLMTLKPPRWPREVMPVDDALAARGKALFVAKGCAACHALLDRDDLGARKRPDGSPLEVMTPIFPPTPGAETIGSDPWMACNLVTAQAATGKLQGRRLAPFAGQKFGAVAANSQMLNGTVKYVLLEKAPDLASSAIDIILGTHPPVQVKPPSELEAVTPDPYAARRLACQQASSAFRAAREILAYKGRPLTGVWATGPFLHNGSVPTLYDVLLPPAQRPAQFWVGTRQFDPVKVGFATTQGGDNSFLFQARDAAGAVVQGNSNLGHDYGNAALTDDDRKALVEYMKVIGERPAGS
jgi:hypothetical protein